MTPQSIFVICAVVDTAMLVALRALLATMNVLPGMAAPDNPLVPFGQLRRLHFARFVIVEATTSQDIRLHREAPRPWAPLLVFTGDCDGPCRDVLAELAVRAEPGLREIYSHCVDFGAFDGTLLDWLSSRNTRPAASYVNWLGRTVTQVHEEAALHKLLRSTLVALPPPVAEDPALVHRHLQNAVKTALAEGRLSLSPPAPTPLRCRLGNLLHKVGVPLVSLLLAPFMLVALPFYAVGLRSRERADPEVLARPEPALVGRLTALEDHMVTNQFTAFGDVKPGRFRRYTIATLLYLLNYAAVHIFNRGYLTRVQTIHFAHWIFLDARHRVLFLSNYDGSHEGYMDDFINKVAWGLNLVFSNGVGYPRSRWLIKGGAEYEERFKNHLRRHQLCTDVWYKAYPDATAFDLARNSRIRQGLEKNSFSSQQEIRAWLSLI